MILKQMTNTPVLFQINLRLILVSGKTKEFLFSPSDSAGDIAQHVFDNWPDGKFLTHHLQNNSLGRKRKIAVINIDRRKCKISHGSKEFPISFFLTLIMKPLEREWFVSINFTKK